MTSCDSNLQLLFNTSLPKIFVPKIFNITAYELLIEMLFKIIVKREPLFVVSFFEFINFVWTIEVTGGFPWVVFLIASFPYASDSIFCNPFFWFFAIWSRILSTSNSSSFDSLWVVLVRNCRNSAFLLIRNGPSYRWSSFVDVLAVLILNFPLA